MIISGYIQNNTVILDKHIIFQNGTRVNVVIPDNAVRKSSGLCGIWKDERSAQEIAEEIISSRSQGRDFSL